MWYERARANAYDKRGKALYAPQEFNVKCTGSTGEVVDATVKINVARGGIMSYVGRNAVQKTTENMFQMINRGIIRYSEAKNDFMKAYLLFFPEDKVDLVLERIKQIQLIEELTFYLRITSDNQAHIAASMKGRDTRLFKSLYDPSEIQRHAPIGISEKYLKLPDADFVKKTRWETASAVVTKESALLHELTHYLLNTQVGRRLVLIY